MLEALHGYAQNLMQKVHKIRKSVDEMMQVARALAFAYKGNKTFGHGLTTLVNRKLPPAALLVGGV
eukprot:4662842-Pleurochrysis_carterae.AAC.1